MIIKTKRLLLRSWEDHDRQPFAKLNADPRVREFFPSLLTRKESDVSIDLMQNHIQKYHFGFFAVALIETGEFIGFIGLQKVSFPAAFNALAPAIEIGWRLGFEHWNQGYATEGALQALEYGFETLAFKEIVSFTAIKNLRSRHVMEKIGMQTHSSEDFDHPNLPEGHALRKHVLYRLQKKEWQKKTKGL